jgi:hypothetical protein
MRNFLFVFFCLLFWTNSAFAGNPKNISSAFCKDFTADQIPIGNFQQPLAMPLSTMRVTQGFRTTYEQGYCQVGIGQFSTGDVSCLGQKIYYGHDGLDLHPAGSKAGQNNVMSVQNGLVVASHAQGSFSGWGESIIIATRPNQFSEEILTFHYHHLHAVGEGGNYLTTRLFNACEQVKAGQIIAKEGGTPNWPTHLHFSIKHWHNLTELKDRIINSPGLFYGYGYTFGDDGKIDNFVDPEGLLFDYFREFNQDKNLNTDWQWSKSLTLFMRSKGWEFGLFDGRFGVATQVKKRDTARWLKIALELPTSNYPLVDARNQALFTDLKNTDYDFSYINTLAQQKQQLKIIDGNHSCVAIGSHFCPDSPITKIESLKMVIAGFYQNQFLSFYNAWVWKCVAPLAQNLLSKFQDVSPLSWYAPFVYFAWQNNLIGSDPYFFPDLPVRKGDLAKWLVLAYQHKHNSQSSFCQKLECPSERYCEESTHQCEIIPSCLPKEGLPCPLGGGYQIPVAGDIGGSSGDAGGGSGFPDASTPTSDGGVPNSSADGGFSAIDNGSSKPVCKCSKSVCCDGCNFLPASQICATYDDYSCQGTSPGDDVQHRLNTRRCTGFSSDCIGQLSLGSWATYQNCTSNQQCVWSGSNSYCKDIPPNCVVNYTASPSGQSCYTNANASGSPTICLETKQQSGGSWQWRVCKQGGAFSNNYSYLLLDQNHLSQYFGNYSGSAGGSCSDWQNADLSYLKADGPPNGAGLKVQILSPSNCSSAACTYFSGFVSLYRNCL